MGLSNSLGPAAVVGGGGSSSETLTYSSSITPDLTEAAHKIMTAVNGTAAEWTLNKPSGDAANFFIETVNDGAVTLAVGAGVVIVSGAYNALDEDTNLLCCTWDGFNLRVAITDGIVTGDTDPFFSFVETLIHFDVDLTTEVTGKTVTESVSGTPTLDTTTKKFGAGSMDVDGGTNGEGVTVAEGVSGVFNLNGEWTLEGWFSTTNTGEQRFFTFDNTNMQFSMFNVGTQVDLDMAGGGRDLTWTLDSGGATLRDGSFHHIAYCRDSSDVVRFFVDGVAQTGGGSYTDDTNHDSLEIGYITGFNLGWVGKIDECRLTVGKARYLTNFTVPDAPFPDS